MQLTQYTDYSLRVLLYLGITDELVSTDIVGDTRSSIVDTKMTMQVGEMTKLLCWYDNEAGYATRLVDMGVLVAKN